MSGGLWTLDSPSASLSLEELIAWGEAFGRHLRPPRVVAMSGALGAGKTTLIQAMCRGYGVTQDVTSPTFALVHEYRSPRGLVFHLDLYRLRGSAELTNIGWDEIVNANALVLVEWPERAEGRLPGTTWTITLAEDPNSVDARTLTVTGTC